MCKNVAEKEVEKPKIFRSVFLLTPNYTQSNFVSLIGHKKQCCGMLSPNDTNYMNNLTSATPLLVALPESEWNSIKDLLNKVKDTLQTKSESEINSMWLESTKARKMLGVSAKTWQDYRDKRVIPFSQFGRKIYFRRADIEAFLEKHCIKANVDKERRSMR